MSDIVQEYYTVKNCVEHSPTLNAYQIAKFLNIKESIFLNMMSDYFFVNNISENDIPNTKKMWQEISISLTSKINDIQSALKEVLDDE